jgi:N-acyl amino acid synthase of PEP-CTERM/exosortase system
MGFENKDNFPREQEFDIHDQYSAHFIVRHKSTGHWVGAVRLIFQNDQCLPIMQHCNLQEQISIKPAVELSRLCVVKEVRRKRLEDFIPNNGANDETNTSTITHNKINRSIIWGLFNAVTEYCYLNNIETWYFITTTALAKILRRGGCHILNIGAPCMHNGERYPFKKDVGDAYFNEEWRINYKNSYRMFSELET